MTMDLLYSLPALAVAICLTGAVLPKTGSRRRRYSKLTTLTARFTVFALLLATVITLVWPVPDVESLFQGLVITFICLVPLIVYLCVTYAGRLFFGKDIGSTRRVRRSSRRAGVSERNKASNLAASNLSAYSKDESIDDTLAINEAVSEKDNSTVPIQAHVQKPTETYSQPSTLPPKLATNLNKGIEASNERNSDEGYKPRENTQTTEQASTQEGTQGDSQQQETEVKEQMDRVSTLVKSYDLGDETRGSRSLKRNNLNESALAQSSDLASHNEQALQVSRTEALRKVIATLQEDKRKLQRLVIAQQAAFDSERQSHERTRHVARDAIKVMRDARSGQRMAEKIARRERAERRRLEKEYTKVTRALKNAMSTLASAEKDNTSAA